jgi:NADPH2:quinone reductase
MPRATVSELAMRSTGLLATHIGYLLPERERLARIWNDLVWFVGRHRIRPVVGSAFPFARMADAHALMESRRSTGKIVVELGN